MGAGRNRRDLLEQLQSIQNAPRQEAPRPSALSLDETYRKICMNLQAGKLIPIIGDTVRNEHIFDIDLDGILGINQAEPTSGEASPDAGQSPEDAEESPTITEMLTERWAKEINYPMKDSNQMARVAQYYCNKLGFPEAKSEYLTFHKKYLLDVAHGVANISNDSKRLTTVRRLLNNIDSKSFADIVDALDYPLIPREKDPLAILASLPISIYITTGYYDFLERALINAGRKNIRTNLSLWPSQPENILSEHLYDATYKPSPDEPLVYHLYGLERYPESMVICEDDYLDFLVRLVRGNEQAKDVDTPSFIPPTLQLALKRSSLLLLGYRLQDWDFRVLFRGLLATNFQNSLESRRGLAIQVDPREQKNINDVDEAEEYLTRYFGTAKFQVLLSNTDKFIRTLKEKWDAFNGVEVMPPSN